MKMKTVKQIKGKICVQTGLRIGGSTEGMEIGGNDNPVLRNPANNEPYIPGSSLKGKMRSLLEWHLGKVTSDDKVHTCNEQGCVVCTIFGSMAGDKNKRCPTRIIVRDCFLSVESRQDFINGQDITEVKYENTINRITSKATPRPMERVVPGTTFDLDISYRVFDIGDEGKTDEKNFNDVVLKALALVQSDYLGGAGSRGCGKVEFKDLKDETGKSLELPKV